MAVIRVSATSVGPSPQRSGMPLSASVEGPFSKSSMAQAMRSPMLMVSSPSSLQR